jgi:hypothetical protein
MNDYSYELTEEPLMSTPALSQPAAYHRGPNLGILAIVYTLLFNAGLYPVTIFGSRPPFPGPWESGDVIVAYFQTHPIQVLACAFLHFGAFIVLGLFTGTVVSRLYFLGVRAAGPYLALFGGFATVFSGMTGALVLWVMARPGIAQDAGVTRALYYLMYALGGPGFSVPFGLLIAGVSVPALILKLLPRWVAVFGLVLAVFGELSFFNLIWSKALFLIPLTRFPGFVWLILAGCMLPKARRNSASHRRQLQEALESNERE